MFPLPVKVNIFSSVCHNVGIVHLPILSGAFEKRALLSCITGGDFKPVQSCRLNRNILEQSA
jgi:hypothetical protein